MFEEVETALFNLDPMSLRAEFKRLFDLESDKPVLIRYEDSGRIDDSGRTPELVLMLSRIEELPGLNDSNNYIYNS